jgi:hypothetical protein
MQIIAGVDPNYVNFTTFSNDSLTEYMCNCVVDLVDKTQTRTPFSQHFFAGVTSLQTTKEVPVFSFEGGVFAQIK